MTCADYTHAPIYVKDLFFRCFLCVLCLLFSIEFPLFCHGKIVYNETERSASSMAKERIGIMGGTFNPVHLGHIRMAKYAMQSANLDHVLFMPDGTPPHKTDIAPAEHRWRMVCVATCMEKGLVPSEMELIREGTTYTIDTLHALHDQFPKADFYYIIGADTLMELHKWKNAEQVFPLCTFLVAPRILSVSSRDFLDEKKRLTSLGAKFMNIDMPLYDISSSMLRDQLKTGSASPLFPATLQEYCGALGLYGLPRRVLQSEEWFSRLFSMLTVKRFSHTLAVAYTARNLARNHRVDPLKAEIAALLHDCAKCLPLSEMQRICTEHALTMDTMTLSSGNLLHSIAGAYLAATDYGVEDPDILRAISCHTTGKVGMTKLDMVVFLADKIEPTREDYPSLQKVRMLAPLSLERAMLASLEGTASYVKSGPRPLHPQSVRTMEWLRTLPEVRP